MNHQNTRSLLEFPIEVLLLIRDDLGFKAEARLASTCTTLTHAFIETPRNPEEFILKKKITYLQLATLKEITIANIYYKPALLQHVLTFGHNLKQLKFKNRKKWPHVYVNHYFGPNVKRKMTYCIPEDAKASFLLIRGKRYLNVKLETLPSS